MWRKDWFFCNVERSVHLHLKSLVKLGRAFSDANVLGLLDEQNQMKRGPERRGKGVLTKEMEDALVGWNLFRSEGAPIWWEWND